jgi:hypothetical protein
VHDPIERERERERAREEDEEEERRDSRVGEGVGIGKLGTQKTLPRSGWKDRWVGWWDPHLLGFNESVLRAFVQTQRQT